MSSLKWLTLVNLVVHPEPVSKSVHRNADHRFRSRDNHLSWFDCRFVICLRLTWSRADISLCYNVTLSVTKRQSCSFISNFAKIIEKRGVNNVTSARLKQQVTNLFLSEKRRMSRLRCNRKKIVQIKHPSRRRRRRRRVLVVWPSTTALGGHGATFACRQIGPGTRWGACVLLGRGAEMFLSCFERTVKKIRLPYYCKDFGLLTVFYTLNQNISELFLVKIRQTWRHHTHITSTNIR